MRFLGLIPARGGSKGITRKNVREIAGKPLIAWTINAALSSRFIDSVVVSTDDSEIAEASLRYGAKVPFRRPAELSTDSTAGIEPVLHALGLFPEFDVVVLLQPTSPLRRTEDIDNCIEILIKNDAEAVVSVTETKNHPAWSFNLDSTGCLEPFAQVGQVTRRQDLRPVYSLNGAVYVSRVSFLKNQGSFMGKKTLPYIMPAERSVDIDDMLDFRTAEMLLKDYK